MKESVYEELDRLETLLCEIEERLEAAVSGSDNPRRVLLTVLEIVRASRMNSDEPPTPQGE